MSSTKAVLCQFRERPDGGGICGRRKHQFAEGMHPICPVHDRLACPKCHVPIIDGAAYKCPSCQADVRMLRKDVK